MSANPINDALKGAMHRRQAAAPLGPAVVLGAGGWLGAALLAQVLAAGHSRVGALVQQRMASTHRGLVALTEAELATADGATRERWTGATAYLVLERHGLAGARDAAFVAPQMTDLPLLGRQLRAMGVKRLFVVVPHAASRLPEALRHGFADGDEQALAQLGFDQLVFVRSSRDDAALPPGTPWLQRFAAAWWSQLRWMLPDAERPLRSVALARVVVAAARLLRSAGPGVRVLPQGLASRAAQAREGMDAVLKGWVEPRA